MKDSISELVEHVVLGLQEGKARRIVTVDMSKLDAPCLYFVICEGNSSTHVSSIATELKDFVREQLQQKPFAMDGMDAANWVAVDYGQVIVHIFQPEVREFYDIEHLWADAAVSEIPDLL